MLLVIKAQTADSPDVFSGQRCEELLHILANFSVCVVLTVLDDSIQLCGLWRGVVPMVYLE